VCLRLGVSAIHLDESVDVAVEIEEFLLRAADIDADALAQSFTHGLLAYRLIGTSSQLISIDSTTGGALSEAMPYAAAVAAADELTGARVVPSHAGAAA